jgi:hypothetical protein
MTPTTETIDAANARTPLTTLARSLGIATTFIIPALLLRFSGIQATPVLSLVIYGAAVIGASFLLAWAAEAAQIDVSGGLAIAVLALIAVLPEYAVDLSAVATMGGGWPGDPNVARSAASMALVVAAVCWLLRRKQFRVGQAVEAVVMPTRPHSAPSVSQARTAGSDQADTDRRSKEQADAHHRVGRPSSTSEFSSAFALINSA